MSQTSLKGTVKSCSCRMCRRGKKHSGFQMKQEERAARHRNKQALHKDPEAPIPPAHNGSYTD